jgi:hypothetical protein
MRLAFREALFGGDLELALAVGDEITKRFPQSPIAAQFRRLRSRILRRAMNGDPTPRMPH